jgi:hypothetical protein
MTGFFCSFTIFQERQMSGQPRKFWAGGLHPGDIVFHKGKRCQVAGDYQFSKKIPPVPAGHVPIFYRDVAGQTGPVYTAPLDDIDMPQGSNS